MPATEQTWRDTHKLHVVFALTGVAMLVSTLWMFYKDHAREWKDVQRQFQLLESQTSYYRMQDAETGDYEAQTAALQSDLDAALADDLDTGLFDAFVKEAKTHADANGYRVEPLVEARRELARLAEPVRAAQAKATGLKKAADDLAAIEVKPFDAGDPAPHKAAVADARRKVREARQPIDEAARQAGSVLPAQHEKVVAALQAIVTTAKFDEDQRQSKLKFGRADLDVVRSEYSIGVDEGLDPESLRKIEERIAKVESQVDSEDIAAQEAKTHRLKLQTALAGMTAAETQARKNLSDHESDVKRLQTAFEERKPNLGKRILELPIIDAFGRPLKIEQIWLPQLTLNNNFRDVARFDRCTTCHLGIDKTAPGSAVEPGYEPQSEVVVKIAAVKPKPGQAPTEVDVYGFQLAERGLLNPADVTVEYVLPGSAAARGGLQAGDVIRRVNDAFVYEKEAARGYLLGAVEWGRPQSLTVSRGVPQPFSSHPRLDLFVGSTSPHKAGDFGCTICHDGQGSATDFKWASHTPNDPTQAGRWADQYGWFNNHHWIFPMLPDRFAESNCLKCHHNLAELEPSERFPDPPAPKLMEGYHLIRQYGCFGCHEIKGYVDATKRKGPDLRAEPPYFAAAAALLAEPTLTAEERALAAVVAAHPEKTADRKRLAELLRADALKTGTQLPQVKKLVDLLAQDDDTPGQYRKVGPSLRYVGAKVDATFLVDWVANPTHFRPSTKMPRFFGLHKHLTKTDEKLDKSGHVEMEHGHPAMADSPGLADALRFEPIEIRAVAEYLLAKSQTSVFQYVEPAKEHVEVVAGKTTRLPLERPSKERGKQQFQTRGCLACHQHPDFPEAHNAQGPNLASLGGKLRGEAGRKWLYSWVREPSHYHARTVMPNLYLTTLPLLGSDGKPTGKATDPAADIVEYLLSGSEFAFAPETAEMMAPVEKWPESKRAALDDLVRLYLRAGMTRSQAERVTREGIPAAEAGQFKGDEIELVVPEGQKPSAEQLARQKLQYIGRRTISQYGCAGCHDLPGFEDAKPIGTNLDDWGRKETSKLAFEQIIPYLTLQDAERDPGAAHGAGHHALSSKGKGPDEGFFIDALLAHQREGFLWQKLREPRSYDFKKTENKAYTDRLRMPQFSFSEQQRQAVMTFVLGLVAEPPLASKYVYQPKPRQKAIQAGEQLITKFNCSGCHMLDQEQWSFDYVPKIGRDGRPSKPVPGFAKISPPLKSPEADYYDFLQVYPPKAEIDAQKTNIDRRGLAHAHVVGWPTGNVLEAEEEGDPSQVEFQLWQPAIIDGSVYLPGQKILLNDGTFTKRASRGGEFAHLLVPVVQKADVNLAKETDKGKLAAAWGWVPPPLMGEGKKVQTPWLHDFLLDPFKIRPATVLNMPKFNMTSDEAAALANYFAARDNADYPYEFDDRKRSEYLASADSSYAEQVARYYREQYPQEKAAVEKKLQDAKLEPKEKEKLEGLLEKPDDRSRFGDALRIVQDRNYCMQCHLVESFAPAGSITAQAPRLDRVASRMRPEFLRRWLALPAYSLPYTGMPVNFPPEQGAPPPDQQMAAHHLFVGNSKDRLDAMVDLLLNWSEARRDKQELEPTGAAPMPPPNTGAAN